MRFFSFQFVSGFVGLGLGTALHVNTTTFTAQFRHSDSQDCNTYKFSDLKFIAAGGNGAVFSGKVSTFDGYTAIKFGRFDLGGKAIAQAKLTEDIVQELRAKCKDMFDGERLVLGSPYHLKCGSGAESLTNEMEWKEEPEWFQVQPLVTGMSVEEFAKTMKDKAISGPTSELALKAAVRMLQIASIMVAHGVRHNDFHLDNALLFNVDGTTFNPLTATYFTTKLKIIDLDTMSKEGFSDKDTNDIRDESYDINLMISFVSMLTNIMTDSDKLSWELAKKYALCVIKRFKKHKTFEYTFRGTSGSIDLSYTKACLDEDVNDDSVTSWSEWNQIQKVSCVNGPCLGSYLSKFADQQMQEK